MTEPALEILLLLMSAAFAAGFVDAIDGGGGLITIPALLLAGLSLVATVAGRLLIDPANPLRAIIGG